MASSETPKRPWILALVLAGVVAAVVVALLTSEPSGTGATNVGEAAPERGAQERAAAGTPDRAATATATPARPSRCQPTESNPGGTNNYIPDAPERASLGEGFVITGTVRAALGCRPLRDVRIQVWLATETGGEQDNRASVRTDENGVYRIETAPTVAQFGEPNIHVAYADGEFRDVFIRRVVDLDDVRARVDLTLARDG
jgi:hypothetical protein